MAKKVRRPPEEAEAAFEFPEFDDATFLTKEFELGAALALSGLFALLAGALSWAATYVGVGWYIVFPAGLLYIFLSYFGLRRLRGRSDLYTKGDWAGLLALQFFAWLAVWFVLVNVT